MNKEQEAKFKEFVRDTEGVFTTFTAAKAAWQACLKANGIREDYSNPPNKPCGHESDKPCDCELNREEPCIPDGYFKIDEKVEVLGPDGEWIKGTVVVVKGHDLTMVNQEVRRIPAWKPKDGEAVFVKLGDKVGVDKIKSNFDGIGFYGFNMEDDDDAWVISELKPFNASKIGKPWSEI